MEKEKISIIVPIYNVEKYLSDCIDSLSAQTYPNIEIILVDDGSPDHCPQICDQYVKQDSRIKVIHKKNGGLSDARNVGLKAASGKYIMYVDSDDYIEIDACEQLLKGMQEDVDFVVGAIKEIRKTEIVYQKHTNLISGKKYGAKEFVMKSIQKNEWYAPAVLNLYRRSFLLNNGLFFKVGFYFEDTEMLPRLYLAAKKIVYIDYSFYNYVIRENSIMTTGFTDIKKEMAIKNYNEWMKLFNTVKDQEYQRCLYGILIKFYITTTRNMGIFGWKVNGLDFRFAWKYAINWKEKLKIVVFNFLPKIFIKL